jgi:hypothetical protein
MRKCPLNRVSFIGALTKVLTNYCETRGIQNGSRAVPLFRYSGSAALHIMHIGSARSAYGFTLANLWFTQTLNAPQIQMA